MSKSPLVTVCIPSYNCCGFIGATIDSVLKQTYTNYNIIIQDDRSTDGTWEIISQLAEKNNRIKVFRNSKNLGMCANWNVLIDKVEGEYFIKLDSDDLILPDFLYQTVTTATDNDADLVSVRYSFYYHDKDIRAIKKHDLLEAGITEGYFEKVINLNPFSLNSTLIRTDFFREIAIDKKTYFLETEVGDFEFLLRSAIKHARHYYIPTLLGLYRMHQNNSSKKPLVHLKSFYFDVLSLKHGDYLNLNKRVYRSKIETDLINYTKRLVTGRDPFNFQLYKTIILYWFKTFFTL